MNWRHRLVENRCKITRGVWQCVCFLLFPFLLKMSHWQFMANPQWIVSYHTAENWCLSSPVCWWQRRCSCHNLRRTRWRTSAWTVSQCSVFPSRRTHWRSWTAGTTCKASEDVRWRIISLSDIPATAGVAADEREPIIMGSSRPIISLPSVILIPLKVGLWHGVGLTLQHSPLAQSHSDVSALWHSGSI